MNISVNLINFKEYCRLISQHEIKIQEASKYLDKKTDSYRSVWRGHYFRNISFIMFSFILLYYAFFILRDNDFSYSFLATLVVSIICILLDYILFEVLILFFHAENKFKNIKRVQKHFQDRINTNIGNSEFYNAVVKELDTFSYDELPYVESFLDESKKLISDEKYRAEKERKEKEDELKRKEEARLKEEERIKKEKEEEQKRLNARLNRIRNKHICSLNND